MATNSRCSLGMVGLAFFMGGGLVGAAMALLLAPQSGRQSRQQLRGYAERAQGNVHDLADKATQIFGQALDTGEEFITDKHAAWTEAVEAGRVAMQEERGKRSNEKKG